MSTILAILATLGIVGLFVLAFLLGILYGIFTTLEDLNISLNLDGRDEDV